jgi:hypothetical protein
MAVVAEIAALKFKFDVHALPALRPDLAFRLTIRNIGGITSGLPTTRKLVRSVNPSAFLATNPTDEPITSGLPVIQAQSQEAQLRATYKITFSADFAPARHNQSR